MWKWNDMKLDIKKGVELLKSGSKKAVKQAVIEVDILKLKYEREKVKKELISVYQRIGEMVYDMSPEGRKDISKDPVLNKLFDEAHSLEESEKRLDAEISETREYLREKKGV